MRWRRSAIAWSTASAMCNCWLRGSYCASFWAMMPPGPRMEAMDMGGLSQIRGCIHSDLAGARDRSCRQRGRDNRRLPELWRWGALDKLQENDGRLANVWQDVRAWFLCQKRQPHTRYALPKVNCLDPKCPEVNQRGRQLGRCQSDMRRPHCAVEWRATTGRGSARRAGSGEACVIFSPLVSCPQTSGATRPSRARALSLCVPRIADRIPLDSDPHKHPLPSDFRERTLRPSRLGRVAASEIVRAASRPYSRLGDKSSLRTSRCDAPSARSRRRAIL